MCRAKAGWDAHVQLGCDFSVQSRSSLIAAMQTVERQEAGNGRVANSRQRGLLAQLVEQRTLNPLVECSSHSGPTTFSLSAFDEVGAAEQALSARHTLPLKATPGVALSFLPA